MGTLLAIDPGLRGCGVALFDEVSLQLVRATYVSAPNGSEIGVWAHAEAAKAVMNRFDESPGWAVIEFPRIYPIARQKGDQNDLLEVAGVASACAALLANKQWHVLSIAPRTWKGQVPKEIMSQRILNRLSVDEIGNLRSVGKKDHNTVDAIGIGLWHLKRL